MVIFCTEMTLKVDFLVFFPSKTSEIKYANRLYPSQKTNITENYRFGSISFVLRVETYFRTTIS